MAAKYLVRFDDICPTMNWRNWERIEQALLIANVKPLLGVVPDNKDKHLDVSPPVRDFWDHVRDWQHRGWTIAVHGYQHLYESTNSGVVGINPYSEFAGLPESVQRHKLERAIDLFNREGVKPNVWIAPGHSFDEVTMRVLLDLGVRVVSDGFYLGPRWKSGLLWIPQQLWRFRRMPAGVWTVCLHHNEWSDDQLNRFSADVARFRDQITSLDEIVRGKDVGPASMLDEAFMAAWGLALKMRRALRRTTIN